METQLIQSKIHEIRGQRIMLDRDLAEMYGVETRRLNEQVKRNISRFPEDFMFQLTKEEVEGLMSHFAMSSWGGTRKLPYAFTELGVAMLSSVLNSQTAIQVNIAIMRAFVAVRQLIAIRPTDRIEELRQYLEDIFTDQNDINEDTRMRLELIEQSIAELQANKRIDDKPRRRIGFYGDEENV